MLPDAEALVIAYLRDTPAVTAITDRIATRHPDDFAEPWVLTQLLDEPQASAPALHLIRPMVQLDVYAGDPVAATPDQREVSLLARTVREALAVIAGASHTGAFVTESTVTSRRLPDTTFDPARERYIITCSLTLHAA